MKRNISAGAPKTSGALSFTEKTTYSAGSAGDSLVYTLIGSFFMFFLTTVAGLDPAAAGAISAVGAIWNALFNPVMGYYADHFGSRGGRRRPLILFFGIPLMISVFLSFTSIDLPSAWKNIYYGVMVMLYWTSYTGVFLPYLALGAAYSHDYNERTVLRLYAALFNNIGSVTAMSCTTLFVGFLESCGFTTQRAWSATGALMGIIAFASFMVTYAASKEKDPPCEPDRESLRRFSLISIIKEYISILKLKPVKYLVIASVSSLICQAMVMACAVYFFTFNMGFSSAKTALLLTSRVLVACALIPVSGRLAMKFDKHRALIILAFVCILILVAVRLTGTGSVPLLALFILGVSLSINAYWQLMPSIFYDVCDYDTYVTGKKRQATVLSLQGLVESAALGIGALILGIVLKAAGFDGALEVQSTAALNWIFNCTTLLPAFFMLLMILSLLRYPLTREKYYEILAELARREAGDQKGRDSGL